MLEKLKLLLGITDNARDSILQFTLDDVAETVKNYCNIDSIPDGLSNAVVKMAVDIYRNEQFGDESSPQTVKSISEGDTSTSFESVVNSDSNYAESLLKDYKKQLNRYRKVGF